jgi:predicted ATPase
VGGLAALWPLEGASTPETDAAPVDPIGARRDLYVALRALLEDLTRSHPLLLAVDDLHLVDAASLDALRAILDVGAARISLVGTVPDDRALPPPARALLGACRRVELDRLTEVEIGELLERTLGRVRPSPALLREIRRFSGGTSPSSSRSCGASPSGASSDR